MPIPFQRDLDETHEAVTRWLQAKLGPAEDIPVVSDMVIPEGAGNANETILFSVTYPEHGHRRSGRLVLRIAPINFPLFMDADFGEQFALLQTLNASTVIPAPKVRWYEPDESILGAPFFIMEAVQGLVPPDRPSYNVSGTWVAELTVKQRERLWRNAMRTFCGIHTDPGLKAAEKVIAHRLKDRTGLCEQLDYWKQYTLWTTEGAFEEPIVMKRAYEWLEAHAPSAPLTSLSWGDARLENMMFDDKLECVAIFDWEMASLGGPLLDLGWWLFCDRFICDSWNVPRIDGLGDRTRTCSLFQELTGIAADDVQWYEVFAAYRMSAIVMRMYRLWKGFGVDLGDWSPENNPAVRILSDMVMSHAWSAGDAH